MHAVPLWIAGGVGEDSAAAPVNDSVPEVGSGAARADDIDCLEVAGSPSF